MWGTAAKDSLPQFRPPSAVLNCSCSCFLSARIANDTWDMLGFISGRPGLCGTYATMTLQNIYKCSYTQHLIIHVDVRLVTQCIIPAVTGSCNMQNMKVYIYLFLWQMRRFEATQDRLRRIFFLCSMPTPELCDKSQHRTGDSFITSFTLHFQPKANFWLGL